MHLAILAAALLLRQSGNTTFAEDVRKTVAGGLETRIATLFQNPADSTYLFEMAHRTKGLGRLRAAIIPSPPGWTETGPFLLVVHEYQGPEADHDPVYATVVLPNGQIKIGSEIPEDASPQRVRHLTADVHLHPAQNRADFAATVEMEPSDAVQAPLFRLNDIYKLNGPGKVLSADDGIPVPREGDMVRAGSLLIPWSTKPAKSYQFTYSALYDLKGRDIVDLTAAADADRLDDSVCYITAYWAPSLGRNPNSTNVRVTGPKDWVLRSEGVAVSPDNSAWPAPQAVAKDEQIAAYQCDVPISFPKVVGGKYRLAAELAEDGTTFRFFQLEPVDANKGQEIVRKMADALADYKKWLGPFPYPSYEAFQGYEYDGMESYSYTVISPRAFQYASHELGHTYFGGLVPCTYIHDTWNESLTQYIDSVAHLKNADKTLETGLRTLSVHKAVSQMNIPWADGNASYFRGAYIMKMLEAEIGLDNVLAGLKAMVADRRGKETRWGDVRQYMEASSKDPLDWFWKQWVDGASFPTLEIIDVQPIQKEGKYQTLVTVRQSGTANPFNMKFVLRLSGTDTSQEQFVTMTAPEQVFVFNTAFAPKTAAIDVFKYALATIKPDFQVKGAENAR